MSAAKPRVTVLTCVASQISGKEKKRGASVSQGRHMLGWYESG